jgi:hypothetical protein
MARKRKTASPYPPRVYPAGERERYARVAVFRMTRTLEHRDARAKTRWQINAIRYIADPPATGLAGGLQPKARDRRL